MKKRSLVLGAMLIAAMPALAQEHDHNQAAPQTKAPQGGMMSGGMMSGGMQGMQKMGPMLGQHMLPVAITAIDGKTGVVEASTEGMALKLHFPPAALAGLKAGDKITVHLAFHKG